MDASEQQQPFQVEGELRCRRLQADTGERYTFAIHHQLGSDGEHMFTLKVTNWRVPAWSSSISLREINTMLKSQGAPPDLDKVKRWLAAATLHKDARLIVQDDSVHIHGLFEYGAKQDWWLRLPPKGGLQPLDAEQSHELIDEISGRLTGKLRATSTGLEQLQQQLERERCEHQALLSARDAELARLREECEVLKGKLALYEGRTASVRNHNGVGSKRQRGMDKPSDQALSQSLPLGGTQPHTFAATHGLPASGSGAPSAGAGGGGSLGLSGGMAGVSPSRLRLTQPAVTLSGASQQPGGGGGGGGVLAAPSVSAASHQVSNAALAAGSEGGQVMETGATEEVVSGTQPQPGGTQAGGPGESAASGASGAVALPSMGPVVLPGAAARGRGRGRLAGRGRLGGPPRL